MNTMDRMLEPVRAARKADGRDLPLEDPTNAERLTRVILLANGQSARIVGITGDRSGVGASATARQLAAAYARFGRKVLLVDASRIAPVFADDTSSPATRLSLLTHSTELRPDIAFADLASLPLWPAPRGVYLREMLEEAAGEGRTVIVDLPPVLETSGRSLPAFATAGGACDVVFLVCLSGAMRRKDLTSAVDTAEVAGVKLGGLILNDWKLTGSRLLEG